jgi:hypothetical protein
VKLGGSQEASVADLVGGRESEVVNQVQFVPGLEHILHALALVFGLEELHPVQINPVRHVAIGVDAGARVRRENVRGINARGHLGIQRHEEGGSLDDGVYSDKHWSEIK